MSFLDVGILSSLKLVVLLLAGFCFGWCINEFILMCDIPGEMKRRRDYYSQHPGAGNIFFSMVYTKK